jgi:hypothetical protein
MKSTHHGVLGSIPSFINPPASFFPRVAFYSGPLPNYLSIPTLFSGLSLHFLIYIL